MAATISRRRWENILLALEALSVIGAIIVSAGLWMEGWRALDQELVVIGVGIEAFVAVWILVASRTIQSIQERELAEMQLATAHANARAAEANLEIEKLKAPRAISEEQRAALVAELRPWASPRSPIVNLRPLFRVEVFALLSHSEVTGLRDQIVSALRQAGWDAGPNMSPRVPASHIVEGIVVEIYSGLSENVRARADALVKALRNANLTTAGPAVSHNFAGSARIELLIGNKPQE